MASRTQILSLYHQLLRESSKFQNYNFREYFLRRTKDGFKSNRNETNQEAISKMCAEAEQNLQMLQRQVILGNAFAHKSVMNKEFNK